MKAKTSKYQPFLSSRRLALRPLTEEDVDGDYAHWLNDPEVCAQNSHAVFPRSLQTLRDFVKNNASSRTSVILAMELKKSGRHIGNVSLQNIQWVSRNAEVAILIGAKDCWSHGYGGEAIEMMLEYGFGRLNLHRIYCGTLSENTGFLRLAEKLGFKKEGCRREAIFKEGKYQDIIEFGMLQSEFGQTKGRK